MADDHLDKETSVSAEITETGIKASAKSRFVAAIDRLGGAIIDNLNARVEGSTDLKRAKTRGEVELMENIVQYGVKQLGASPEFAERAFNTHFRKVLVAQENKDQVLLEAQRDLEEAPPPEGVEGHISEDFFTRFEPFAEAASSEDLQQLFGRILAGEVRQPGSVSAATLRLCSQLDQRTAALIEKACAIRGFPRGILKSSFDGYLNYSELMELRDVGFLPDVVLGASWTIPLNEDGMGVMAVDRVAIGVQFTGRESVTFNTFPISAAGVGLATCLRPQMDIARIKAGLIAEGAAAVFIGRVLPSEDGMIVADELRKV